MITAREIRIQADLAGLLAQHQRLARIEITGLHVLIPTRNPAAIEPVAPPPGSGAPVGITSIQVDGATLDFLTSRSDRRPFHLDIASLTLAHVNEDRPLSFVTTIRNTDPPGNITASGNLGPWDPADSGATPVSGAFTFDRADLSVYRGIAGTLSARGAFQGSLRRIAVTGDAVTKGFHAGTGHSVDIASRFQADVDAENGNTTLSSVQSRFRRTTLLASGTIAAPAASSGKLVSLHLGSSAGRVEDFLYLLTAAPTPAMTGPLTFQAAVTLPPGPGFLERVGLSGAFGIDGGAFSNPQIETPLRDLSNSASGVSEKVWREDPKTVLSDLKGHVDLHNGLATLTGVSFSVPGAQAEMRGAFNLLDNTVDLRGVLHTSGDLSDATSGFKALVLKVVTPFMRRKRVTTVPFILRGPAANPSFSLDFDGKRTL